MSDSNENSDRQNNKRSNKPLMERKRRERINNSLEELKSCVLIAENKDVSKYTKLEKADILEMTVRHVTKLHQKCPTDDGVTKYRAGFSHCTSVVESFLTETEGIASDVIQRLLSLLHEVSNSFAKENIPQSNHKVRATTDKSILGCRPIRPKRTHPLETICPQFGSEVRPRIQATTVDVPCLPSPPSDCTVSPQPHRLTPIAQYEIEQRSNLPYPPLGLFIQDRRSALTCNYIHRDVKPLNLTLHEHMTRTSQTRPSLPFTPKTSSPFSGRGHSLPNSFSAQEPPSTPNLPPTPPSEQLSPISHSSVRGDAQLITSSRSPSSVQRLKDSHRPTPYPKKDAVKRYHSQILKRENEDRPIYPEGGCRVNEDRPIYPEGGCRVNEDRPIYPEGGCRVNEDKSSNDHWRPW